MKQIFSLILAVTMVLGLLGGCSGNSKKANESNNSSTTVGTDILSKENVSFIDADGKAVYRIVRPENDDETSEIATSVFKGIKGTLGLTVKNVADFEDGTDKYEILIGNTNRPESDLALQYLIDNVGGRYNDYIICTIGKKIVINGKSMDAIKNAAEYFLANMVKSQTIEGGILYTYATEGNFTDVTINGVAVQKFQFVCDATSRSWLIQNEVSKVQEYIKEKTGYWIELLNDTEAKESEYEVNIGSTNRPGAKAQSEYTYDQYEIIVSGKKVYIMGGSSYAVQVAVTEFCKFIQTNAVVDSNSKTGSYSQTIGGYDSATYYRLVWGDDFDGNTLDESKWIIRNFDRTGHNDTVVNMVKNDSTFEITGGNLIMRGFKKEEGGYIICDAIKTDQSMYFNRGYLEIRARIPDGKGVYSSFWTNGPDINDPELHLELDVFESLGKPHIQQANIHKVYYENGKQVHISLDDTEVTRHYELKEGTLFDQYHTVGMLWDDTRVSFYYDGIEYYSEPTDNFYINKYIYVIAGFNIGWADRRQPDEGALDFPVEYIIDYIRLYQVDGQGIILK